MKAAKALLMMVTFAIVLLAFSLANAGAAQAWLHHGPTTQYPSAGGKWQYGFWNVKVRSYYTVNRCHGSTVILNGARVQSANTRAGYKSIAEKGAIDGRRTVDEYYYRTC